MRHHYTVVQPEPKKRGACNPKQDGEPGKATRSRVYQEEKVSGNTWPTSVQELQKETHSSANYCFPGFCCFPLKKLSSWTLSSRKMQIATEYVIEKTWHKFKILDHYPKDTVKQVKHYHSDDALPLSHTAVFPVLLQPNLHRISEAGSVILRSSPTLPCPHEQPFSPFLLRGARGFCNIICMP